MFRVVPRWLLASSAGVVAASTIYDRHIRRRIYTIKYKKKDDPSMTSYVSLATNGKLSPEELERVEETLLTPGHVRVKVAVAD